MCPIGKIIFVLFDAPISNFNKNLKMKTEVFAFRSMN